MAYTFLDLVNKLRRRMRDEPLAAFAGTDDELENRDLLNDAASEVLDTYDWDFMNRDDGQAYFPGLHTGTTLTVTAGSSAGQTNADAEIANSGKWASPRRSRIVHTDSSTLPNVSYKLDDVTNEATRDFVLDGTYRGGGATGTGAFTLYCHEQVLPSSVKQVLSVVDEDRPLHLEHVDKHTSFDRVVPRALDSQADGPSVVYVGSGIESTSYNVSTGGAGAVAGQQGMGRMVWPIPEQDVLLDYSYVAQHVEMTAAADVLTYVPDAVAEAIVWVAFDSALVSNIESDGRRAVQVAGKTRQRLERLQREYSRQPLRRRVMEPFRRGGRIGLHPNHRWANKTIPAP